MLSQAGNFLKLRNHGGHQRGIEELRFLAIWSVQPSCSSWMNDRVACEEKKRLVAEYESTTNKFAAAVKSLQQNMGTSSRADYDRLQRATDRARVQGEQARLALERHVAEHGC